MLQMINGQVVALQERTKVQHSSSSYLLGVGDQVVVDVQKKQAKKKREMTKTAQQQLGICSRAVRR
jgi:hypothetical protein